MRRLKNAWYTRNEMQTLLDYIAENKTVVFRGIQEGDTIRDFAYITETKVNIVVVTNYKGICGRFIYREDEAGIITETTGYDAYIELAREYKRRTGQKIPDWSHIKESARAYLGYRKDTDKTRIQAIGYDVQSAYTWAMRQDMPDTSDVLRYNSIVKKGEIGFITKEAQTIPGWVGGAGRETLQMVLPGDGVAEYVFASMPSPFADYADRWYDRKVNAKDPQSKYKAKAMVNFAIGYLQRKNPFLRAAVVEWCNRRIMSLIDENSIWCNTDCIVSTVPRDDLPISNRCGDFKIEHEGQFAHVGFSYQWDFNTPSIRGIPQSSFTEQIDLLKGYDTIDGRICKLNRDNLVLEDI